MQHHNEASISTNDDKFNACRHYRFIRPIKRQLSTILILTIACLFWATGSLQAQGNRPMAAEIVGGVTASQGEYPWQVWFEAQDSQGFYACGASLIHPKWVLTAGHCIGQINEVVLGAHRINSQSESTRQVISVKRTIRHPNYNDFSLNNDIALIELNESAQLNQWVATIPLVTSPTDDALVEAGILSTVTGWGATREGGGSPNALREVSLPLVSRETCREVYGNDLTSNMICAGFPAGGKDSCQGDSGGPMVVPDNNGGWKQAGVVSWGDGCARANAYGVYTKLSNYESWIGQYVELESGTPTPTTTTTPTETPTATETPVTTPVTTPTPTTTPVSPATDIVANGDFEQANNGEWTESSRLGYLLIYNELPDEISAQSGEYVAWLGGDNNEVSNLIQSVQLPEGDDVTLNFSYQIVSADNCRRDKAYVRVNNRNIKVYQLCTNNETDEWVTETLSLAEYAGQEISLRFRVYTNGQRVSSFLVDDVAISGGETIEQPSESANILNGDLEQGANGEWREFSKVLGNESGVLVGPHAESFSSSLENGGDYVAWLGGLDNEVSRLRQNIDVPESGSVYLTYDYEVLSDESRCNRDRARVFVAGKRLHQQNLCKRYADGWQQQSLDLSKYAGQTVRLDFWTRTNGSRTSSFFVDNIRLTSERSARSGAAAPHDFIYLPIIVTD